ncbi:hypoxanthine phosphoribosyltransferase [Oceanivirga miroungae]|uniref:Hypoxanthine phosphoribosyltransferase n=1 Tax=Oceanivirga miroungae TaxID=1130046 RepID=A0A6I8M6H4_9FUSO|nr:hypoxanthine phosphoribosyltransferase [Oceanivirga miroungae]VWL85491.1 hypoxanthine phosphoribosyltransferase [Oceanivirga miroungae]
MKYHIEEMIAKSEIANKVRLLADNINKDLNNEDVLLIGLLRGSVMFLADIAREINNVSEIDFMSVSSYGSGMVTSGEIKILKDLDVNIEGKNVIIIEDIIDTGFTLSKVTKILKERNPKSLRICTLLDKPERRVTDVFVDYVGFIIPDEFVVGYGIDYAQKHRALSYIGKVVKDGEDNE